MYIDKYIDIIIILTIMKITIFQLDVILYQKKTLPRI